ncbi:FAD-dependent hydroxylase [Romeria aff. gracilis LEGE 07310]|uniref:FAD-dependent hydroxylase n=1 Tax=Vasconcelosia minhoensis LEGE 07310 TaxID=915328 RepID=A0A8J7AAJ4_9CYAN|nr:FAD-dependent hydroxylase [Romeria gracilis]MBE9077216.1 FAD-dependent hydroxylase [Romeria aff. gracilis LEGE 07310]
MIVQVPDLADDRDRVRPQHQTYDLVIVGGGIVGLTLACGLRQSGLSVAVIEAQTAEQAAGRQRAYAFSPLSAEILRGLGLWAEVGPQLTPFQQVQLSDANYPKVITFRPEDARRDAVYYSAEHSVLMAALQRAVSESDRVDYWCSTRLTSLDSGEDVKLLLEQDTQPYVFKAQLLIGADGSQSQIRQTAGIHTQGWPYSQSCITAVVQPKLPQAAIAYEKFWPSGPFAILPISQNRCQIVWTAPHAEAEALLAMPRSQFMAELQQRLGDSLGEVALMHEPFLFPVRLMQCRQYIQPRLALIGDAAHCCHPVGGQGLNMGIRDAAALAEVLQRAAEQGEDVGSLTVLRRYERWRRTENWVTLGLTDLLNRTFSNQWLPLVIARRLSIWLLDLVAPLKRLALRLMTGFFGRLPNPTKPGVAKLGSGTSDIG